MAAVGLVPGMAAHGMPLVMLPLVDMTGDWDARLFFLLQAACPSGTDIYPVATRLKHDARGGPMECYKRWKCSILHMMVMRERANCTRAKLLCV